MSPGRAGGLRDGRKNPQISQASGERVQSFFVNLAAILAGAVLFAAVFPNLLVTNGVPFLAWIVYVPVFFVINRSGFRASVFWGALYGYSAYGLFNYWLSVFHPLGGLIVGSIYLAYLALLFPLLRLAVFLFPRRGYILQWLIWISFEYLRTRGFLGYAYGITGYSQWNLIPVIQIAGITGVWGVSALLVFPSVWLAAAIGPGGRRQGVAASLKTFLSREWLPAALWLLALTASLIYGFSAQIDYSGAPTAKMALIQHNTDPWKGDIDQYRKNYDILKRLSDEAIRDNPDLDLVVWSETAFVPRIYWHQHYRDDWPSWNLVSELLEYLAGQETAFVIGNDDARREPGGNRIFIVRGKDYDDCVRQIRARFGESYQVVSRREVLLGGFRKGLELSFKMDVYRVDYNAAMLFEGGTPVQLYRKLHLVPFTENFPYEKQLPWVYDALINSDTHFWKKGDKAEVFDYRGIKFSTPICFEDTFGYLSRNFVRNGAEIIVNLSNDAWSKSLPAQMQHLSMAVFRAVENRRSMVRATASGQTCSVDPNGRILAMAEPFTEAALTVTVPIVSPASLYTRFGDWLPAVFIIAAFSLLITGIILYIIKILRGR
jgi:apolipoprotein N-acyltransferase